MKATMAQLLFFVVSLIWLASSCFANPYEELRQVLSKARSQTDSSPARVEAPRAQPKKRAALLVKEKIDLHQTIVEAAGSSGIPPALLATIIVIESACDPCAVSKAGAKGLAQFMDATAREYKVFDPFDPNQALFGSSRLIRALLDRNDGKLLAMAASYNAGGRVLNRRWEHWPSETRNYLDKILRHYPNFTEGRWQTRVPQYIPATNKMICQQDL